LTTAEVNYLGLYSPCWSMNGAGRGDSVKRGVGRLSGQQDDANEQRKWQRNQSYGYNMLCYI